MTAPLTSVAALAGPTAPPAPELDELGAPGDAVTVERTSFADVLAARSGAAKAPSFSRHALERVNRRGIVLDPVTIQRLTSGLSRAASKGSRDAVVFVDGTAFVVSVPNSTVITAVGSEHMREHVFTNIDSAVIA